MVLLPPILLPQAFTLRLEPTRIAEYLVGAAPPTGQAVSWIQHTSNTNPAAAVAELAAKPDIAPVMEPKETVFSLIAGLCYVSRQMFDDYSDVQSFLPVAQQIGWAGSE